MRAVFRGDDRGVTHVEYAVIIAAVSVALTIVVPLLGGGVGNALCRANSGINAARRCETGTSASSTPSASNSGLSTSGGGSSTTSTGSTSAAPATSGTTSTGSASPTSASSSSTSVNPASSGSTASASPSPSASAPTNSAGTSRFNTALIDQDQVLGDLSARVNLSWFPNDWNNLSYPQSVTIDVTWSPALDVDSVTTGTDGTWKATLVSPGHMRLVRTGDLDASGFQPEPEILLKKPTMTQQVSATFTATVGNSPTISQSSSTTSIPYS